MADLKISQLPAGTVLATDEIPVNEGGTTKKVSTLSVASLFTGTGSRTKGLIGVPNAGTPNTQYDLSADEVILINPSSGTSVARFSSGTLTNNILTAGPAANGRDQAAAFNASSWIHLYFIWNGTTLATLSSATAPPTGPVLPGGYTHWVYAGSLRLDGVSNLIPTRFFGSTAMNNVADAGANRVLSAGTATVMTAVDCSGFIPPNSRIGLFNFIVICQTNGGLAFIQIRPTGSTESGQTPCAINNGVVNQQARVFGPYPVNAAQSLDYQVNNATSAQGFIDVFGYHMPNGDS